MVEIVGSTKLQSKRISSAETHEVITDFTKSDRSSEKIGRKPRQSKAFSTHDGLFSERKDFERLILSAVRHSINIQNKIFYKILGTEDILEISKICRSVSERTTQNAGFCTI